MKPVPGNTLGASSFATGIAKQLFSQNLSEGTMGRLRGDAEDKAGSGFGGKFSASFSVELQNLISLAKTNHSLFYVLSFINGLEKDDRNAMLMAKGLVEVWGNTVGLQILLRQRGEEVKRLYPAFSGEVDSLISLSFSKSDGALAFLCEAYGQVIVKKPSEAEIRKNLPHTRAVLESW